MYSHLQHSLWTLSLSITPCLSSDELQAFTLGSILSDEPLQSSVSSFSISLFVLALNSKCESVNNSLLCFILPFPTIHFKINCPSLFLFPSFLSFCLSPSSSHVTFPFLTSFSLPLFIFWLQPIKLYSAFLVSAFSWWPSNVTFQFTRSILPAFIVASVRTQLGQSYNALL